MARSEVCKNGSRDSLGLSKNISTSFVPKPVILTLATISPFNPGPSQHMFTQTSTTLHSAVAEEVGRKRKRNSRVSEGGGCVRR